MSSSSTSARHVLFLVLLWLYSAAAATSAAKHNKTKCHPDDEKALLAAKKFWNDPSILATWTPATACCSGWYRVECDSSTGRVAALYVIADDEISGGIPPSLGSLSHLRTLVLRKLPRLAVPVPAFLAPTLTTLHLDSNALTGPIPASLAGLPQLESLDLSFNRLSGGIPPALASLPLLADLRLDGNRLTGPIPDSFGRFKRPGLDLHLSRKGRNLLSGPLPASLGDADFHVVDLSSNSLSGDAPPLFLGSGGKGNKNKKNAALLAIVDLSRNKLEFDFGRVEFPAASLVSVDLSENRIYGGIPRQVAEVPGLVAFNVSHNRLCGEIPTGGNMRAFPASSYSHNRCLCGEPLPPCKVKY